MLIELALGCLLAKRSITLLKSIAIATIAGVFISWLSTLYQDMIWERSPLETELQFVSGCLFSPMLTMLARYACNKFLARRRLKKAQGQVTY
jgi:hypothetical protein